MSTGISDETIKANIAARETAAMFVQLIDEDATNGGPHFAERLWTILRTAAVMRVGKPEEWSAKEIEPMSDAQADYFSHQTSPFQKYRGSQIGWILEHDEQYLHWLVSGDSDVAKFLADLNRFLARTKREDTDGN